jgi:ferredoxin
VKGLLMKHVLDQGDRAGDGPFTVIIASTGRALRVDAGRSILDVLEANAVGVLSSCREGICGTCETPVVRGDVVHRDFVLTDEERQAGDCLMVCVSRASTPELVLGL